MKEVYIENSEIENWTYRDVYSKWFYFKMGNHSRG
jgi:hypothetical protein